MRSLSDRERQFRANFHAWCLAKKAPGSLPFDIREDRILFRGVIGPSEWVKWLDAHFPIWTRKIKDHQPTGEGITAIEGWREPEPFVSAQVILHSSPLYGRFFELDWDWCNAERGVLPAIGHGIEWAWNKTTGNKTGPYAVRRWLVRRGIEVEKV